MTSDARAILLSRRFDAPADMVFRAFTEPALLVRWFRPAADVVLRVERFEMRLGGAYRLVFYSADGQVVPVIGEYRTVEPASRLAFTWTWERPNPWAGIVTLVTVTFRERDGGTEVDVHHTQLGTLEMKQRHEAGWAATLASLAELFERK